MGKEYHYGDPDRPKWCDGDSTPQLRPDIARHNALAREIQEDLQRTSGREISEHIPTNFLRPEQRQSFSTPAGTSVYVAVDPRPDARADPNAARLAAAEAARRIAAAQQLSGSSMVRRTMRNDPDVVWAVRPPSGPVDWSDPGIGEE